ncbi:uncharacterized protein LOC62_01G001143 [Vanrija pseudolonga]|uniref:GSKIP domain-containing protein n=1 Tax=Vanrija pseudolonga TaxID=143232 RepID=A0AAF0Y3M4_9TREE|nr:hypothetical protein LOC62_01G001143 [Vanrija pseudolonga]
MSTTPPEHNLLLDPISELRLALASHAFGVDARTELLEAESFPRSAAERAEVQAEADLSGHTPDRVVARARVVFLAGEGEAVVSLSAGGYRVDRWTLDTPLPTTAYESLDALLIASSPAYVAAMQAELHKRFASDDVSRRFVYDDDDDGEEPAWID